VPLTVDELERRIVPALLGEQLFPADYPTNNSIANAPVSASSTTWISAMAASRSHLIVDWGAYTPSSAGALYSMPYNVVHSKDTVNYTNVKVYINNYPNESDLSGTDASHGNRPYVLVPMPKSQSLFIEGDSQTGPASSRFTNGGSDSHLIIWDADTNTDYEFWESSRPSESSAVPNGYYNNTAIANQWNAANEATWNMNADSFRTLGYTSADAAGLPILNNVVRPDEVLTSTHGGQSASPVLDHALRFTLTAGLIHKQFMYPASHVASGAGGIPYGARFRLKNDAATNSLIAQMGPESQVIARALQQYGLILADIGSSMFVQGAATSVDANNHPIIDPTTGKPISWDMNDLMPDAFSGTYTFGLDSIPTTAFEAVDLTPKVTSLSDSSGTAGTTITITGANFTGAAGNLSVLFVPPGNSPPYTSTPAYPNGQTTTLNSGVVVASAVTIVDDQHLQVVVPSGLSGTVDIQVISGQLLDDTYNSDSESAKAPIFGYGISQATPSDKFTYSSGPVAPAITTQPGNQTVTAGNKATFTAGASGSPTPTVQWQLSTDNGSTWNDASGATATTYSFTTTASQTGYEYRAVFTNSSGSATTNAATLTVNVVPSVTTNPSSQTLNAGQTATFTAAANGAPAPTVQWQVSTNKGSSWSNIPGATATSYSFAAAASQSGYEYRAVFTNAAGSATTSAAALTVNVAVQDDFNRSDSATLGANWTGQAGSLGIRSNQAAANGTGVGLATYIGTTLANVAVQADITLSPGSSTAGLVARYAGTGDGNGRMYDGRVVLSGGIYTAMIEYVSGGVFNRLATKKLIGFSGTGTIRFEVVGNSLKLFVNGVLQLAVRSSGITGAGLAGIRGRNGSVNTPTTFDNFSAQSITAKAVALPFQDSFTNADNSELDPVWIEKAGAFQIMNDMASVFGAGAGLATLNAAPVANVSVQTDFLLSTSSATAGLVARYSGTGDGNGKMYDARVVFSAGVYTAMIEYVSGGVFTTLRSVTLKGFNGAISHTLEFVVNGNSLQLFLDDLSNPLLSVTNSAITTAGFVGIRGRSASFDNFSAM
jgi:hypothetical protein